MCRTLERDRICHASECSVSPFAFYKNIATECHINWKEITIRCHHEHEPRVHDTIRRIKRFISDSDSQFSSKQIKLSACAPTAGPTLPSQIGLPMNDQFLNIRIWQIFNKMSHIEANSIENWLTYQSE